MEKDIKKILRRVYYNIKNRCYNPNGKDAKIYYKRNITVCDEWLGENGFKNFYNWAIEHNFKKELTLDRIDNDKGYSPNNCHWITDKEQSRNKTNNKIVEYQGQKYTMIELSEKLNIPYFTLTSQFRRNSNNIGIVREKRTVKKIAQYTLDYQLIKIWNSTMEIERATSINHSRISKCCYHKQGTQQCAGYRWEFYK